MTLALALRPEQRSDGEQRQLTYDDLQQLPSDEALRYELLDGELLVSPAPNINHQLVVRSLLVTLHLAAPSELEVLPAPTNWYVCADTVLEPDVLAVHRSAITDERYVTAPSVLAVEVLSPSTRSVDLGRKKERYAKEGVAWYWVAEPVGPQLTAFRLTDGAYVEEAAVFGDDVYEPAEPFPVTVVPATLLD